ncbi:MAG: hypothetical protein E7575_02010 [Ruminococcaceae bacterium]|nr:hypothetical protein [Oscillospiraceae bacterium]
MKKIIIPKSIKKFIAKGIIKRFIILIIGIILAAMVIQMFIADLLKTSVGNVAAFAFLILLVPFWISGIPMKLFDRSYVGTVLKIEIQNPEIKENYRDRRRSVSQFAQFMLIKDQRGKLHYTEIFDEGEIFEGRKKYYNAGDKVVHIYGTEYIRPLHPEQFQMPKVCVVCGHKNSHENADCQNCSCSLDIIITERKKRK